MTELAEPGGTHGNEMLARGAAPVSQQADSRFADLIADHVIPRLVLSCRGAAKAPTPGPTHVDTLARLALSRDVGAAAAHVAALREAGAPIPALLNDLIGPAAIRLGDFWSCDSADFAEVAIGASRLVQIARALGVEAERALPADAPRALIASPEAERHNLGGHIVGQCFRAEGWRVTLAPGERADALVRTARAERYDFIGLSIGSDRAAEGLDELMAGLRSASRATIALGGPVFACDPDRALALGADFVAADARKAVAEAGAHLSRNLRRRMN